jgi:hypothetical protein
VPKSMFNNDVFPFGIGRTINIKIEWTEEVCWEGTK